MAQRIDGSVADVGEFGLIDRMVAGLPETALVGPGDDAAVVAAPDRRVVVTTDVLVEGVHFRRDWSTPVDVGRKAAAASLADVAAMGARPTALVVGLGAPPDTPAAWAVACAAALQEEGARAGAGLVGGDVVTAPVLVVSVTALGDLEGRPPVLLGWSAAGLAVLSRGMRKRALVEAHRYPEPDYAAGPRAALAGATSLIDVSDGLVADARHVAQASAVTIDLHASRWEVPDALAEVAAAFHVDAREWMLTGGEDHALLATFPSGTELPTGFAAVGEVRAGEAAVLVDGEPWHGPGGHVHFG
jgi:thiamine-monophosphate kinase